MHVENRPSRSQSADEAHDECSVRGVTASVIQGGRKFYVAVLNAQFDEVVVRERVLAVFDNEADAERLARKNYRRLPEFSRACLPMTLLGAAVTPEIEQDVAEESKRSNTARRKRCAVCPWCKMGRVHRQTCPARKRKRINDR